MAKIIFMSDIHGPMTDEPKQKLYDEANVIMIEGDMVDNCRPINQEILKHIPVIKFNLEDLLNLKCLGLYENYEQWLQQKSKK